MMQARPKTLSLFAVVPVTALALASALAGCETLRAIAEPFGLAPRKSEAEAWRGTPQLAAETLIHALAKGNLDKVSHSFADQVTVIRGSSLLDEKLGGLGGEAGRTKSKTVSRQELIDAYHRLIDNTGGMDKWQLRGEHLLVYERQYLDLTDSRADVLRADVKTQPNDVVMLVDPQTEQMLALLRKDENLGWLIIALRTHD
jgi:hypothetical protein